MILEVRLSILTMKNILLCQCKKSSVKSIENILVFKQIDE